MEQLTMCYREGLELKEVDEANRAESLGEEKQ